jgi:hypothetical protein
MSQHCSKAGESCRVGRGDKPVHARQGSDGSIHISKLMPTGSSHNVRVAGA